MSDKLIVLGAGGGGGRAAGRATATPARPGIFARARARAGQIGRNIANRLGINRNR